MDDRNAVRRRRRHQRELLLTALRAIRLTTHASAGRTSEPRERVSSRVFVVLTGGAQVLPWSDPSGAELSSVRFSDLRRLVCASGGASE